MVILVTRAPEDSERTARRLAALGHEALLAPASRIERTPDPAPAGPFDALIVTSAHAYEALVPFADKQCPVFAVGPHTAAAVGKAGFSRITVAEGDAKSLSSLIQVNAKPGIRLLHVTARHHKDEPAASLRAAGFEVVQWEAYEARAVQAWDAPVIEALRAGRIDTALHYSRRSAEIALALTEEAGLTSTLRTFPHLCLSEDVAAPLEAVGLKTLSASEPHEDSLLVLLDRIS